MITLDAPLQSAAEALSTADALFIGAGAGLGGDSGMPDFRGDQGFWRASPPYPRLGVSSGAGATPRGCAAAPALALGFSGHRLNLCRATPPHGGFGILKGW